MISYNHHLANMIHQAVVSLVVSLANSFFFWHFWTLGSGLKLQFILQMNYQFLIYENDRWKQWFSYLVCDMRLRGWTAQTHIVVLSHFDIFFAFFFLIFKVLNLIHNGMAF